MVGAVLLVVGIVLLGVAGIVFAALGAGPANVQVHGVAVDPDAAVSMVRYGVSGLLGLLGLVFVVVGLVSLGRGSARKQRQRQILETGIDAEGTVTFVDRNFRILVNRMPVYSIVEYTYRDGNGAMHTRRIDNVNSEVVIRKQVQVGSKIAVKYARDNPAESVMILA